MKTQYHYVGENISKLNYQIIEKYNLSNEIVEVIKIINTEKAYDKLNNKIDSIDEEGTHTIFYDHRNRKVISDLDAIKAATVVLRNNVDEIKENELSWKAKLVMIFSHLIDHDNHYIRSIEHQEEAKKFFYEYVYEEKQIDLLKVNKNYECNFELKFVPQKDKEKRICQDFCTRLKSLYINLDLHYENNSNIL